MPAATPSHVRIQGGMNRTFLSDLSMLVPRSYPDFIRRYPKFAAMNYILTREAAGDLKYTPNKLFYNWSPRGKNVPTFQATAAVTASAGVTSATVQVATPYYLDNGLFSPAANGHYYRNDTNGQIYVLSNVNTNTAGAHTVTLTTTRGENIALAATDILIFYPTVVGEKSGTQEGIYRGQSKLQNECATIKANKDFSDWSMFEKLDVPGYGQTYRIKDIEQEELTENFMYQQETLLMFNPASTNVAGVVNNHNGLIPQIQLYGQTNTTSTQIDSTFWQNQRRVMDAEGYAPSYDFLMNIELRMKIEDFIGTTYNNGAIVYNKEADAYPGMGMEINRNFKAYDVYGYQWNFMTYDYFNSSKLTNAPVNSGLWNNSGLLIPRGESIDPESGVNVPRFCVRYQAPNENTAPVKIRQLGGWAEPATDDIEHLLLSHVTTKGLHAFGLNGYGYIKLNA